MTAETYTQQLCRDLSAAEPTSVLSQTYTTIDLLHFFKLVYFNMLTAKTSHALGRDQIDECVDKFYVSGIYKECKNIMQVRPTALHLLTLALGKVTHGTFKMEHCDLIFKVLNDIKNRDNSFEMNRNVFSDQSREDILRDVIRKHRVLIITGTLLCAKLSSGMYKIINCMKNDTSQVYREYGNVDFNDIVEKSLDAQLKVLEERVMYTGMSTDELKAAVDGIRKTMHTYDMISNVENACHCVTLVHYAVPDRCDRLSAVVQEASRAFRRMEPEHLRQPDADHYRALHGVKDVQTVPNDCSDFVCFDTSGYTTIIDMLVQIEGVSKYVCTPRYEGMSKKIDAQGIAFAVCKTNKHNGAESQRKSSPEALILVSPFASFEGVVAIPCKSNKMYTKMIDHVAPDGTPCYRSVRISGRDTYAVELLLVPWDFNRNPIIIAREVTNTHVQLKPGTVIDKLSMRGEIESLLHQHAVYTRMMAAGAARGAVGTLRL